MSPPGCEVLQESSPYLSDCGGSISAVRTSTKLRRQPACSHALPHDSCPCVYGVSLGLASACEFGTALPAFTGMQGWLAARRLGHVCPTSRQADALQAVSTPIEPQEDPEAVASSYWTAIAQALDCPQPDIPTMGCNLHWIANHCAIESQVMPTGDRLW